MRLIIFNIIFTLIIVSTAHAAAGLVTQVTDGDSIVIITGRGHSIKANLYGVDAPELKQDFGRQAKENLSELIYGHVVAIDGIHLDEDGNNIVMLRIGSRSVSEEMIRTGSAWVDTRNCEIEICDSYLRMQDQARETRQGLWSRSERMAPWVWARTFGSTGFTTLSAVHLHEKKD